MKFRLIEGAAALLLFFSNAYAQDNCCSYNYKDCAGSAWCEMSADNCIGCSGAWIVSGQNCTARWQRCQFGGQDDCCNGVACQMKAWGSGNCEVGEPTTLMPTSQVHLHGDDGLFLNRAGDGNGGASSTVELYPGLVEAWWSMKWTLTEVEGKQFEYFIENGWNPGLLNSTFFARDGTDATTASLKLKGNNNQQSWIFVDQSFRGYDGLYQIVSRSGDHNNAFLTRSGTTLQLSAEDDEFPESQFWRISLDNPGITSSPTQSPTKMPSRAPTGQPTADTGAMWSLIDHEDFETGWGNWNDPGADARRSSNDAQYAPQGSYSIRLRDDTDTSVITSISYNVEAYSQVSMTFSFRVLSFENSEYFFVESSFDAGSSWGTLISYVNNVNMTNGDLKLGEEVSVDTDAASTLMFRFHCQASGNQDYIYVDDITIMGLILEGTPSPPTMSPPTSSPSDGPTQQPTLAPTWSPTILPTKSPSPQPSSEPTATPTESPSSFQSPKPTDDPSPTPILPVDQLRIYVESSPDPLIYLARSGIQNDAGNYVPGYAINTYTFQPSWGSQKWRFHHINGNQYRISNSWTNATDTDIYLTSTASGDGVRMASLGDPGQIWTLVPTSSSFKIMSEGGLFLILQTNGNQYRNLALQPDQNISLQKWFIADLDGNLVDTVPSPTSSPSAEATPTPVGSYPTGPYVSSDSNSERITLRTATETVVVRDTATCPHTQSGLLDWHNPSTWGGTIPVSGQDISLPPNSKVVILQAVTEALGVVTIPTGSELIIGDNSTGITLDVQGMDVQGAFTAGLDTCRILNPVTITLHGARPADAVQNPPAVTFKGISVNGGILNLHGDRFFHTWTRLAKTVEPGDSVLMLQDKVNWQPGQEIVLVTTAMKDSIEWHQNEKAVIVSVLDTPPSGVGAVVYLQSGVQYKHTANSGYQGEVGLLSRTIKIQGDDLSEPSDPDPLTCAATSHWGSSSIPCPRHDLTGFGGHMIVHNEGKGYVDSIELFRMGQTNVLGRYPMHFHLLDGTCPDCYLKASSVHRSFYRCISIHGTHQTLVSENVAYDIRGYCYYLEDGVEEDNELSFNLVAHVHSILGDVAEEPPTGGGQTTPIYTNSSTPGRELTLPADVTASGFYITNVHNKLIGNAASGGWAGFAFPNLGTALQGFRNDAFRPSSVTAIDGGIDANSAHSSGWWWSHAGAFYFGGALYYEGNDLKYNPGRSFNFGRDNRRTCAVNACLVNCEWGCKHWEKRWVTVTNTKTFLAPGVGVNSWSGRMEFIGYESHDTGLSIESLSGGFWVNDMLAVCRTGDDIVLPPSASLSQMKGDGFFWYDTAQEHIITESTFRNCGYRSEEFDQYNTNPTRGCGSNECHEKSTVFGFLTHSDQHTPEVMQGTRDITFDNCGRRFYLRNYHGDESPLTVSGRGQSWLDVDGSVTGTNVPSLIASGVSEATSWWSVENSVLEDPQGPLLFIDKKASDPNRNRALGHFRMSWDDSIHDQVGSSVCGNGNLAPCPALGYIKHLGHKFTSSAGLPVTANPDVVGVTGGYGWKLEFNGQSPAMIEFSHIEADPDSAMVVSIPYPPGTTFSITARAADWCSDNADFSCTQTYSQVSTLRDVRAGPGNVFHVDASGAITFRIVQLPQTFAGNPDWFIPTYEDTGRDVREPAIWSFERDGVLLPKFDYQSTVTLEATNCVGYCSGVAGEFDPDVCPQDGHLWTQTAHDECCRTDDPNICSTANQW